MSHNQNKELCPVCSTKCEIFYRIPRLCRVVLACPSCDYKWTEPPLHYDNTATSLYYESPPYSRDPNADQEKARTHLSNITKATSLETAPQKSLLEIGCSNGSLLELLKDIGFEVQGLEISKAEAIEIAAGWAKHYSHPKCLEPPIQHFW